MGFIDNDQHGIPEIAIGIEKPAQKSGCGAHLGFGLQPFERKDDRNAMLADAAGDAGQFMFGAVGLDDHMAEPLGQGHKIALGVDDALLHPGGALFEEAPQKVGFARAGIALHKQAGGQQFLEIELCGRRRFCRAHVDFDGHRLLPAPGFGW